MQQPSLQTYAGGSASPPLSGAKERMGASGLSKPVGRSSAESTVSLSTKDAPKAPSPSLECHQASSKTVTVSMVLLCSTRGAGGLRRTLSFQTLPRKKQRRMSGF